MFTQGDEHRLTLRPATPLCVTCRPSRPLTQAHIKVRENRPAGHRTGRRAQKRLKGSGQAQNGPTGGPRLAEMRL